MDRAHAIFAANYSRGAEPLQAADIEMKHSIEKLADGTDSLMLKFPEIRQ